MDRPRKTHAMRVLDARGVPYRVIVYDDAGAFHSGADAAALMRVQPEAVYRTLVVLRDPPRGRPLIVLAPSTGDVDLRSLARRLGEKRLRMAPRAEAERLTGMRAGAITALGLRRPTFDVYDVYIDERALSLQQMYVSAGERGVELELRPGDFVAAVGAQPISLVD